jgi:superfamily II DNA or RNA helicase
VSAADEVVLAQVVGPATLARGRAYARTGAVRQRTWSHGRTRVVGEVKGSEAKPYVASVTVSRNGSGHLSAFRSTCTCPVGINCKHGVALVLAPDLPSSAPGLTLVKGGAGQVAPPTPPSTSTRGKPKQTDWELPLQALLASEGEAWISGETSAIGLQFDLVLEPGGSGSGGPGIRVRPVIPGKNGSWVRQGISWTGLDYYGYGSSRSPLAQERLSLLREFLALGRLTSSRYSYNYSDDVVRLEAMHSRRLWDLLGEARALDLPLLQSGRTAQPLTLLTSAAEVTVDVTQTESGLRVEPRIAGEQQRVPLETSMLIGRPAHGIAWWSEVERPSGRSDTFGLGLSALATPVDDSLREFLRLARVDVPQHDQDRFLRLLVPRLRQRVEVGSSDGSVTLPAARDPKLFLSIVADDRHHLELTWTKGVEGGDLRQPLWEVARRDRQHTVEHALIKAVASIVSSVPELFEESLAKGRLASHGRLEGMAAVRFVNDILPDLEASGAVRVEWVGATPAYREEVAAPVVNLAGSESTDTDWFDLTVSVTVGGEAVPFTDLFLALAVNQSHLILPSGTYFSLDREELRELAQLIAEARAIQDVAGAGIRLSRYQASLWDDIQRLGVSSAQVSRWEASVRALASMADRSEHAPPAGLLATLRPYQHVGFNWLAFLFEHGLGGVLADDMGLGKTLQALALMVHVKEKGLGDGPFLVVAPTSVVGNWEAECHRFTPGLNVATITETGRRRGISLKDLAAESDVMITSYSLFRLEYDEYADVTWAGLFLDEAQFAKNRQSQAYQRAKSLPTPFKVAMSGTPLENNLMELWSLLSISAPGLFSSPERFGEYYRLPIERHADEDRLAQLRRRIQPLLLRRTKEQVAGDLPDKLEQVLELDLNPKHKKVYQTYLQRERQKILGLLDDVSKNRFAIFRSLTLLRQASLDVSLVDEAHVGVPSTKLDVLMEMLDDIVADGHRVLVFSQFTRFLNMARHRISAAGIAYCYLDGATRNRPAVISEFQNGDAPVFLISLKAGGFGLNLTEADYCILLDPWWNPATEAQAVDRIHRIGQTRKVMVYRLVAKDTLEEKVMALKTKKAALFSNVMDGGGFESGAMTEADIRELLD